MSQESSTDQSSASQTSANQTAAGQSARIRDLNDAFRQSMARDVYLTSGVSALPLDVQAKILGMVASFKDFDEGNDPFGEHDFGAFEHVGNKFFWKIDAYDQNLEYGSNDATDEVKTRRVLTIMLAREY